MRNDSSVGKRASGEVAWSFFALPIILSHYFCEQVLELDVSESSAIYFEGTVVCEEEGEEGRVEVQLEK